MKQSEKTADHLPAPTSLAIGKILRRKALGENKRNWVPSVCPYCDRIEDRICGKCGEAFCFIDVEAHECVEVKLPGDKP